MKAEATLSVLNLYFHRVISVPQRILFELKILMPSLSPRYFSPENMRKIYFVISECRQMEGDTFSTLERYSVFCAQFRNG